MTKTYTTRWADYYRFWAFFEEPTLKGYLDKIDRVHAASPIIIIRSVSVLVRGVPP